MKETQRLLEDMHKRRTPTKEWTEDAKSFMSRIVERIEQDHRTVNVRTVQSYLGLYGPIEYHGFDAFIIDFYHQFGSEHDIAWWLRQHGYEAEPEPEPELPKPQFKAPRIEI